MPPRIETSGHQEPTGRPRPQSPLTPVMTAVEQAAVLDPLVRVAQPVMTAVGSPGRLRDTLRGAWAGHALHPVLVQVPLGAWLSALTLDLTGADRDGRSTQLLTGLGVATFASAALTGWAELAATGQREKRVGVVHAVTNAVGLFGEIAAFVARRRGRRAAGTALAVGAMAALGAGGYLGGHLSVVRKVGSRDDAYTDRP